MIDTDPRLIRFLESLRDRPRVDYAALEQRMVDEMQRIPEVRLGPSMEREHQRLGAQRSVIVGVKQRVLSERGYLVSARARLRDHLYARYHSHLSGVKNERGRGALVSRALEPITARIDPLTVLLEVADLALQDYDARRFAFRDLVAAHRIGDRAD